MEGGGVTNLCHEPDAALNRIPMFETVCVVPTEEFILIPGRTSRQGVGISEGKFESSYQEEIQNLQMAPSDMQRLDLKKGDRVRLTSKEGQIEVCIIPARKDELPTGLLFI